MGLHAQNKGKYMMTKYSISHFEANYHFKDLEAVPLSFYIRKRPIFSLRHALSLNVYLWNLL